MKGIPESISKLLRASGKRRSDETNLPCRRFSLAEIKTATNNFDDNLVIGEGGCGKVYKGFIDDPTTTTTMSVAIKRLNIKSKQVFHELRTEVLVLCQLRHPDLIPFIGYCLDERVGFLVYEFMVNGNLARHLYATNPDQDQDHDPVPWKRRLQICVGVARGLHFLHTGLKHTIIHRDVKPTNILLNEKWEAKLSDFGLSKIGPPSLSKTLIRIESRVAGTVGYLSPEYALRGELTDKSDVYSFGVVLLEVLCGRKASEIILEGEDQLYLVCWARKCKREGRINEIIDPYLMGKIAPECLMVYVNIATSCVRNPSERRPTMGEVHVCLEHALELQESADAASGECNYCVDEYTCNASSGDNSPIGILWETGSRSIASSEELSSDTAMPNGEI